MEWMSLENIRTKKVVGEILVVVTELWRALMATWGWGDSVFARRACSSWGFIFGMHHFWPCLLCGQVFSRFTSCFVANFFLLQGVSIGIFGPAFLDLEIRSHTTVAQMSLGITAQVDTLWTVRQFWTISLQFDSYLPLLIVAPSFPNSKMSCYFLFLAPVSRLWEACYVAPWLDSSWMLWTTGCSWCALPCCMQRCCRYLLGSRLPLSAWFWVSSFWEDRWGSLHVVGFVINWSSFFSLCMVFFMCVAALVSHWRLKNQNFCSCTWHR